MRFLFSSYYIHFKIPGAKVQYKIELGLKQYLIKVK